MTDKVFDSRRSAIASALPICANRAVRVFGSEGAWQTEESDPMFEPTLEFDGEGAPASLGFCGPTPEDFRLLQYGAIEDWTVLEPVARFLAGGSDELYFGSVFPEGALAGADPDDDHWVDASGWKVLFAD